MKGYIGDGVYAEIGQGELILTTENGVSETNRIVLDSPTLNSLLMWLEAHTTVRVTYADRNEVKEKT